MEVLKKKIRRYPLGVWIAILALILICLAWLMQIYSLIDWEGAVKLGIQNESFTGDMAERAIADVERGVAIADILWALPITIVAFIGLLRKKLIGFIAAMMTFAVCVYFTAIYMVFAPWPRYSVPLRPELYLCAVWSGTALTKFLLSRWRTRDSK